MIKASNLLAIKTREGKTIVGAYVETGFYQYEFFYSALSIAQLVDKGIVDFYAFIGSGQVNGLRSLHYPDDNGDVFLVEGKAAFKFLMANQAWLTLEEFTLSGWDAAFRREWKLNL